MAPSRTRESVCWVSSMSPRARGLAADSWSPSATRPASASVTAGGQLDVVEPTAAGARTGGGVARRTSASRLPGARRATGVRRARPRRRGRAGRGPGGSGRGPSRRAADVRRRRRAAAHPPASRRGPSWARRRGPPRRAPGRARRPAASISSAPTGLSAPGIEREMPSAVTSSRSTRSRRTANRPSRSAPSRSSARWASPTTPSSASARAEPFTVCASRNRLAMTWRGDGWASSRISPSRRDASFSSTSARKIATSSGSSVQPFTTGSPRRRSPDLELSDLVTELVRERCQLGGGRSRSAWSPRRTAATRRTTWLIAATTWSEAERCCWVAIEISLAAVVVSSTMPEIRSSASTTSRARARRRAPPWRPPRRRGSSRWSRPGSGRRSTGSVRWTPARAPPACGPRWPRPRSRGRAHRPGLPRWRR